MKALCWIGVNAVSCERVRDPEILNDGDIIVRVKLSSVCGSDLHLLDGHIPAMREGDILGHEFVGEVVEVGRGVKRHAVGDRVVVGSVIACGHCYFCEHDAWSLCDNSNPKPALLAHLYGHSTAGLFGYSHAFGGFAGSHAEYVRVPFADNGAFTVPDTLTDEQVLFASEAIPTGYMAADMSNIQLGDVVAVWGCGAVGQMAIRSAYLFGAERVIAVDRHQDRLLMAQELAGAEVLNYEDIEVNDALIDITGGRGPDACVDAVGMEAHGVGVQYVYDRIKQALRLETERVQVLRQAIHTCRKGGTVSIVGVYAGLADKFPIGAAMNKGLVLRMGQPQPQRYIPRLLEHIERGDIDATYLITHKMTLDEGQRGYDMFKHKTDGCMRVVFVP